MGAGGGNKQVEAQKQQEAARQTAISKNVTDINSAYAGREGQYNDFGAALRKQYGTELARQQGNTSRNLKFSLARNGQTGGSVAVDAGKKLGEEFNTGTLNAEHKTSGAVADLRAKDEASRLQMISLAQSGSDIGNAASQTASALRASLEGAKADNTASGLGDIFGGTADIYKSMQEASQIRKGLRYSSLYANAGTGTSKGTF